MEDIPSQAEADKVGGLHKALEHKKYVFASYITSFIVVGLLWFVHYGMMHFIEKLTPALSFVNNATLFLVGGIPFISGINSIFADYLLTADKGNVTNSTGPSCDELSTNRNLSVRAFCVLLFLASIGQLIFWTVALFQKDVCMSKSIDKCHSETLQFRKIMVFPVVSFITFWGTFSESFVCYGGYNYLLFSSPFIFLLLKVILIRHDSAMNKVKKLRHKLIHLRDCKEVNERTALIKEKDACDGVEVEIPTTTHMKLLGKGKEANVQVTTS